MASRNSIELWLLVTDPDRAREYIARFDWNCPEQLRPDQITLDNGRIINFAKMSDEEAVIAATALLRDFEVPLVMKTKNLQPWEH